MLLAATCMPALLGCNGVGTQPAVSASESTAPSQQLPFTENKPLVVPAHTPIYVRLQQPLSSASAYAGQTFSAVLDEPLRIDEQTIAPQGAPVTGKVVAARRSGNLHDAGYLRITLTSVTLSGKVVSLQTDTVSVHGGNFKKRTYAFIGGGAGGGALIGKEVGFAAERRLGFRLTQPLNIS